MSEKTKTFRLILKDSENRAVSVNIGEGQGIYKLSEIGKACVDLVKSYTNLLKSEEDNKTESIQNDIKVEKHNKEVAERNAELAEQVEKITETKSSGIGYLSNKEEKASPIKKVKVGQPIIRTKD